ncbi:hypothetical protein ACF1AY_04835 [Streptomyces sp. NPDC014776]|uniref:hypothetical protein n=1 Tax=Streptomyces sp. NPDC014776 TaxID=3364909 RepID=UPI0036FC9982
MSTEPETTSPAAGACVLVLLAGVTVAAAFAVDQAAGVLTVVAGGTVALWRCAHRVGTDQPLPSPTAAPPLADELPGQGTVEVRHREGMSIFLRDDADNPARTHVRVELHDQDA